MKKLFSTLFLMFVFVFSIQAQQHTVGLLQYNPAVAFDGYNLHYPHNQGNAYLLNNCGEIVHMWRDSFYKPGNGIWLRENGNLYVTKGRNALSNSFIHAGGGGEKVEIRDWDNNLLWTYTINDSTQRMHHDIEVLPNGNILAIVWEYRNDADAIANGRNPAKLTGSGALGNGLWPEKIVELQPNLTNGTTQIVWEWRVWDHMVQDFDSTKANFGAVQNHPELIDLNYTLYDSTADWQHANSLDYNATFDQIMLSVPCFNEIWIIDHSTTTSEAAGHAGGLVGVGGDLIYRFGNPSAYQAPGTTKLFYQHDAHWAEINFSTTNPEYGKVVVFNNKLGPNYSAVHTFSPTFDTYEWEYPKDTNGVWGPNSFDWTYMANPPQDMYSTGLGAIQLLPNGNRLINEGREGRAFEITNSGQILWEYKNPMKNGLPVAQYDSTIAASANQQFRFTRYPINYPAFIGKTLEPMGYIELNPDTVFCSTILTVDAINETKENLSVYPNPTGSDINIQFEKIAITAHRIEIFDLYGHLIYAVETNEMLVNLKADDWNSGIYLIRIDGEMKAKLSVTK